MANYCCAVRTNYFRVKHADGFKQFMKRVYGCEDSVEVWEEKNKNGETVFGFGCYGAIAGLIGDDEDEDCDYDAFIDGLQEYVADDDAIIIMESGNEKLRYVIGSATIITSKAYDYLDIASLAAERAASMLGNSNWKTRVDY